MQYYVTSDETVLSNEIREILIQLHQECPASQMLRLDVVVSTLESSAMNLQKGTPDRTGDSGSIVILVLAPDVERSLEVLHEIHRRTSARILVVGPATDTKLVLKAMRGGASEYLDQGELAIELTDALKRLDASGTLGRIIGLISPGGGCGASTLAVNVATVLAQKSLSCALIDLKLEAGDLSALLNLKPNHTLSDLCQNVERLDHSLMQSCLVRASSGVHLLAAPARLVEVTNITPAAIDAILSLITRHFPFVVLDLDHNFRPVQQQAMLRADVLVMILRLDFISLRNTRTTLEFLEQLGFPRDRIRFIANKVGEAGQLSVGQVEDSLGIKLQRSIPYDDKTVNRANNEGVPVVLHSPSSKVARSLIDFATSLAEPIKTSQ